MSLSRIAFLFPFLALLVPAAAGQTSLTTVRVASGLTAPVFATAPPGDDRRLFVVEHPTGLVRLVIDGQLQAAPFLDVPAASGVPFSGMYSMAFHPQYAVNGYFYVWYFEVHGGGWLERYSVSADPDAADPSSRMVVLTTNHEEWSHSGIGPLFAPDGTLYVVLGDGGPGQPGVPICTAQDTTDSRGCILRIDVDAQEPYAVPPDNPFVGTPGFLPEIWAYGLRNPWRASFDRATGELYLGDVGHESREEIDYEPAGFAGGRNYGWPAEEGTLPYVCNCCPAGTPPYGDPGYTRPIHEYDHAGQYCAVIGGYVYRGAAIPDLAGTYFFGDWCTNSGSGGLWSFRYVGGAVTDFRDRTLELQPAMGGPLVSIGSFAEDGVGELYLVSRNQGAVFKVVPDCGFESYCSSTANSTGAPAWISAMGTPSVAANDLVLRTDGVPPDRFGYYLMASGQAFVPTFGGSQGNLCLALPIFRFADDVQSSGPGGRLELGIDFGDLPQGTLVQAGETWRFQSWFRDMNPGPTSNTSDGLAVTLCP